MTQTLAAFSEALSRIVASAAPLLSAIRVGPNRHVTGLICQGDTVVTTDQALPVVESYTVVLSNRLLIAARPGPRDPATNLAVLRLESPWPAGNPEVATAQTGDLAIVLGADGEASPTMRLTVIHRFARFADGLAPVLDLPNEHVDPGNLVLDAGGRLIGLVSPGPNHEAFVIPSALIGRLLVPRQAAPVAAASQIPPPSPNQRAWLGVTLQPITVPDPLVARTGQASGRMVVSVTRGGPADAAGMKVGDVLLALDGVGTSGPQALRAFLANAPIGSAVEVKLLRDGNVLTALLTVAGQPD